VPSEAPPSPESAKFPVGNLAEFAADSDPGDITVRAGAVLAPADAGSAARTKGSVVEPEVFVAVTIVDAVDHDGQALDLRMPAGRATGVKDDWTGVVLRQ
jgi:hypothetical protein